MKKHAIFVSLIAWMGTGIAQPVIEWQKCYGGTNADEAADIKPTPDGGYIITGTVLSSNGQVSGNHGVSDIWVVKLDNNGSIEWQKTYGGTNHDRGYAIQPTTDGGYVIAGSTESVNGDVTGHHGDIDGWIIKINASGVLEWQKTLGGSYWDDAWDIKQVSDGGYIVAGFTNSNDGDITGHHGGLDYWIVKLSNQGEIQWQKAIGGSQYDIAYAICETLEGSYIAVGESNSSDGDVNGLHGSSDYWVVKLSPNGELQWTKALGSTSLDRANDICLASDGGYVIVGQISWDDGDVNIHHGGYDYWIVKINTFGEILWESTIGGSKDDYCQSINRTDDGGYIISGATKSSDGNAHGNDGGQDFWLIKLNGNGELLWQRTLGGLQGDWANAAFQDSDGGYVATGYTQSNNSGDVSGFFGLQDFWVVKLSPETSPTQTPQTQTLVLEPNPAGADVRLQIPEDIPTLLVHISDVSGRRIHTINHPNGASLDISGLPNGFYLISARAPDGRLFVGRLGKE